MSESVEVESSEVEAAGDESSEVEAAGDESSEVEAAGVKSNEVESSEAADASTPVELSGVVLFFVLAAGFALLTHAATSAERTSARFADEGEVVEAEVHQVRGLLRGSGENRSWSFAAEVSFYTRHGVTVRGSTAIERATYTELSRLSSGGRRAQTDRREYYDLDPGVATLSVTYLPSDPEHFHHADPGVDQSFYRFVGRASRVLSIFFGFVFAVLAVLFISERRERKDAGARCQAEPSD